MRKTLERSVGEAPSCLSQHVQHPKSPGIISLNLALFSPGHVGVSNFLGLKACRIHVHLWHQTKYTGLGLRTRKKDVVRWPLAVKDSGVHMWEAIPGALFLGTGENRKGGKTNSGL